MQDFNCSNADEIRNPLLQSRARFFKDTEEGVVSMCKMLEDMRNETADRVKIETWIETVKNTMQSFHVDKETAMDALKIPDKYRDAILLQN